MTDTLDTLDEFLNKWIESGLEHYEWAKNRYMTFLSTPDSNNCYRDADTKKAIFGNKVLGYELGRMIRHIYDSDNAKYIEDREREYKEYVTRILKKEAAAKKALLEAKITKEVGEITGVYLKIGIDGSLNGYIEGTKGKVTVSTVGAGGYNIQRYHYRVLIKKVK